MDSKSVIGPSQTAYKFEHTLQPPTDVNNNTYIPIRIKSPSSLCIKIHIVNWKQHWPFPSLIFETLAESMITFSLWPMRNRIPLEPLGEGTSRASNLFQCQIRMVVQDLDFKASNSIHLLNTRKKWCCNFASVLALWTCSEGHWLLDQLLLAVQY